MNGYVKKRSIKTNASFHLRKKYVLNVDLKDFFPCITSKRIYGMLVSKPYELKPKIAAYIANACTLDGNLPQGAPSSPVLSNMICTKLDSEFLRLARLLRCTYTRYADDITFSSNSDNIFQLVNIRIASIEDQEETKRGILTCTVSDTIDAIVKNNGFEVNTSKVRFSNKGSRQEVTGLIVNEKINVKRRFVRQIRAMLHAWEKFGYNAAKKEFLEKYNLGSRKPEFSKVVRGKIAYIRQIKGPDDSAFRSLASNFNKLNLALGAADQLNPILLTLSKTEIRDRSIWVLEDHKADNQGTAFFLKGVGLVTCAHCVSEDMYIYHPNSFSSKHDVKLVKKNDFLDLAVLAPVAPINGASELELGDFETLSSGDRVTLCGYPKHFLAYPMRVEDGIFLRSFTKSAVRMGEISPRVVHGNSGGPVVNIAGNAVAVAARGVNANTKDDDAQFLCVSLGMLKTFWHNEEHQPVE